ncbi:isoprenyl transferase [Desulfonauticus submarinus]
MEKEEKLPAHLAIIMDGNGRWAKKRELSRTEGHKEGVKRVKEIVAHCCKIGIRYLTLYTFSKENWKRPKTEISTLFNLLSEHLKKEEPSLKEQGIKLNILGELEDLPFFTKKIIQQVIRNTSQCKKMTLNLALNYSGREEIVQAVQKIIKQNLPLEKINIELISKNLYTAGQPDPDLVIRTSGEMRLSNFLIFQAAYAELYFTPVLWPDFTPDHLDKALLEYSKRERRFGGLGSC